MKNMKTIADDNKQKPQDIPFSRMRDISGSGVFVKRFVQCGKVAMKPYAHRDDYYIFALLTDGSAAVDIDFDRKELTAGDVMILSPWQVHGKPTDETWDADGWMVAFSPEMLTESEARKIDEYSISSTPFKPDGSVMSDIVALCSMLERNNDNDSIATALASTVKCFVISSLETSGHSAKGRSRSITLKLKKLLDSHLNEEKISPYYRF